MTLVLIQIYLIGWEGGVWVDMMSVWAASEMVEQVRALGAQSWGPDPWDP